MSDGLWGMLVSDPDETCKRFIRQGWNYSDWEVNDNGDPYSMTGPNDIVWYFTTEEEYYQGYEKNEGSDFWWGMHLTSDEFDGSAYMWTTDSTFQTVNFTDP
jgi:hypothetical protein